LTLAVARKLCVAAWRVMNGNVIGAIERLDIRLKGSFLRGAAKRRFWWSNFHLTRSRPTPRQHAKDTLRHRIFRAITVTKQLILALVLLTASGLGLCAENVFDCHVHLWNGETSIKEYLSQLERDHVEVAGFGGILIARAGEIDQTRQKNDELIALAKRYPMLLPIASVHPYDGAAALEELKRVAG